jgi:hypothetical protein
MGNSKGRPSKKFGGSNVHNGGSISQSGSQRYGGAPKPKRGSGGKSGGGPSLGDVLFGKGPVQWGHGGSKKKRKK